MKRIGLPGFTAEASLGRSGITRAVRSSGAPATNTVSPALVGQGGGGGFYCSPDDFTCVDCRDDIDNMLCEECNAGGNLQCCADPNDCTVYQRPTLDCTNPLNAACIECGMGGEIFCCLEPCNPTPPPRTPPNCYRVGGREICIVGPSPVPWPIGGVIRTARSYGKRI
jgi:hypothetical protein